MKSIKSLFLVLILATLASVSCKQENKPTPTPVAPSVAPPSQQEQTPPPTPPAGKAHLKITEMTVSKASAGSSEEFNVVVNILNSGNAKSNPVNVNLRAAVSSPTGASNVPVGFGFCQALEHGATGTATIKVIMSQHIKTTGTFLLTPQLVSYQAEIEEIVPERSIIIN